MQVANNNNILILGAALLRLSGKSNEGEERSTRQMIYVTDNTDKLFLSREACVNLQIIPNTLPTIGEAEETESANSIGTTDGSLPQQKCQCPKWTKPPPIPTSLPFPATEVNRVKLQQYLLDHYASSMFNTCKHQALPLMDSPPMRLMIDPNATPVAHHSPIPVPFHWQDAVKAGLDRDVRLGALEPVPIGEPVTWCYHMVICAKQNGTPRRTIDFQPLNRHGTRETHHTQSPFHQARSVPQGKKKTSQGPHPHPTWEIQPTHNIWRESLQLREEVLRLRHMRHQEKRSEHTKTLPQLQVGDRVWIQNQTGPHPNKWDRTGIVIKVRQFHQYLIRIDGSGRHSGTENSSGNSSPCTNHPNEAPL